MTGVREGQEWVMREGRESEGCKRSQKVGFE